MQDSISKLRKKLPIKKVLQHMHLVANNTGTTYTYHQERSSAMLQSRPSESIISPSTEDTAETVMTRDQLYTNSKEWIQDFHKQPIRWSDVEEVIEIIGADLESIIIVCVCVGWNFPSRSTLDNLSNVNDLGVRVFHINSEKRKDLITKLPHVDKDELIGLPITGVYVRGRLLPMKRKGYGTSNFLAGPMNKAQVQQLVDSVRDVVGGTLSGEESQEVAIKF